MRITIQFRFQSLYREQIGICNILGLSNPTKYYFVTSVQTLGCLISCTYDYSSGKESVSIILRR